MTTRAGVKRRKPAAMSRTFGGIGEEKLDGKGRKRHPARRWVVERTLGWLSKCRAILVRYDKKDTNYLGLLQLGCALLWFRRTLRT